MPIARIEVWKELEKGGPHRVEGRMRDLVGELNSTQFSVDEVRKKIIRQRILAGTLGVAMFGSARLPVDSEDFNSGYEMSKALAIALPVTAISGGGPGEMDAVLKGVRDGRNEVRTLYKKSLGANGKSGQKNSWKGRQAIGVTIELASEQAVSTHIDLRSHYNEINPRVQLMVDLSDMGIALIGGIGTLKELVDVLQWKQIGALEKEYQLFADPFWEPLMLTAHEIMYKQRKDEGKVTLINEEDILNSIKFTTDPGIITEAALKRYQELEETRGRLRFHRPKGKSILVPNS